jgi:hypothetical protein
VLATAFINHYGCVDIWVKLASPGDLVVDIELEIGRIQMMPVTTLTELVAYRKEIIHVEEKHGENWNRLARLCMFIGSVSTVCDAFLCTAGFQPGQRFNDSQLLDGNFMVVYAMRYYEHPAQRCFDQSWDESVCSE